MSLGAIACSMEGGECWSNCVQLLCSPKSYFFGSDNPKIHLGAMPCPRPNHTPFKLSNLPQICSAVWRCVWLQESHKFAPHHRIPLKYILTSVPLPTAAHALASLAIQLAIGKPAQASQKGHVAYTLSGPHYPIFHT
jgi:hypothetical protein